MPADPLITGILTAFALLKTPTPQPEEKIVRKLRLRTRKNARSSVARLIRDFDADENADPGRFRALMRGFGVLLAYDNAIGAGGKLDPAASLDPTRDEPDLDRLDSGEQEEFDRLWMKSRGIAVHAEDE